MKSKTTAIRLSEKEHNNLMTLQDHLGYSNASETLRYCLRITVDKYFKSYSTGSGASDSLGGDINPETGRKYTKSERDKREQVELAKSMDAYFVPERDQIYYFCYELMDRTCQGVPLQYVNKELVADQYLPSREAVEKNEAAGKANYDVEVRTPRPGVDFEE